MLYNLLCENDFPSFLTCLFFNLASFTPDKQLYIFEINEDDHPRMMKHSHGPAIINEL